MLEDWGFSEKGHLMFRKCGIGCAGSFFKTDIQKKAMYT
jgi:hypothetical protein